MTTATNKAAKRLGKSGLAAETTKGATTLHKTPNIQCGAWIELPNQLARITTSGSLEILENHATTGIVVVFSPQDVKDIAPTFSRAAKIAKGAI